MIAERDSDLKELHENLDELLKDFSGVAGILVDDPLVDGVMSSSRTAMMTMMTMMTMMMMMTMMTMMMMMIDVTKWIDG